MLGFWPLFSELEPLQNGLDKLDHKQSVGCLWLTDLMAHDSSDVEVMTPKASFKIPASWLYREDC